MKQNKNKQKCLPLQEMLEMKVQSLGQKDPLEEEMATHTSILALDRGAQRATFHGVTESGTTEQASYTGSKSKGS